MPIGIDRSSAPERFFELGGDLMAVVRRDSAIVAVNAECERALGFDRAELVGRPWQEVIHPDDWDRTEAFLRSLAPGQRPMRGLVSRCLTRGSRTVWIDWTAALVEDCIYASGRDITDQRDRARELERGSGLWRASFEQAPIGICLLTLQGDCLDVNPELCRFLGRARQELVGAGFAEVTAMQDAALARESIGLLVRSEADRYAERSYVRGDGETVWAGVTVTIVDTPTGERRLLVHVVDITQRKRDDALLSADFEQLASLDRLRRALDEDRLVLYAQPIVELASGRVVREELLIRMQDGGGVLTPDQFLPAVERFHLIAEVDHWVLVHAIELARAGRAVNVNVSARSVADRTLLDEVERATLHGLEPALLCFEITETALSMDMATVTEFAQRIQELGCGLAIDDFGVGYGSLTYLKNLPGLSSLKIDRSFIRNVAESEPDQRIVEAMIGLAKGLGQALVAEGIEDEAAVQCLVGCGVHLGQGYYFGRPAPVLGR